MSSIRLIDSEERIIRQTHNEEIVYNSYCKYAGRIEKSITSYVFKVTSESGQVMAVKKVCQNKHNELSSHLLNEIKILQFLRGHNNIVKLLDLDYVYNSISDSHQLYMYQHVMGNSLNHIKGELNDQHFQRIMYQLVCGLNYIHSAKIIHGNLNPGNILIDSECNVSITGFGSAMPPDSRFIIPSLQRNLKSKYKRFMAPEFILVSNTISEAIDMWSLGCILLELLNNRSPLFYETVEVMDLMESILKYVEAPSESFINNVSRPGLRVSLRNLIDCERNYFADLFEDDNKLAVELLEDLLILEPKQRLTAKEALSHEYFDDQKDEHSISNERDSIFEFKFTSPYSSVCKHVERDSNYVFQESTERFQSCYNCDIDASIVQNVKDFRYHVRKYPEGANNQRLQLEFASNHLDVSDLSSDEFEECSSDPKDSKSNSDSQLTVSTVNSFCVEESNLGSSGTPFSSDLSPPTDVLEDGGIDPESIIHFKEDDTDSNYNFYLGGIAF
ncbi:kinase-like domain-containing protein [Scheffersomyces coipomensis]|uniref:kinase-like domain-containing protein n=1 Tax=Scheffersomyces coipomensis TaxID=1788519 RepID=UPI00315CE616